MAVHWTHDLPWVPVACKQALHLRESREVKREKDVKGDENTRGPPPPLMALILAHMFLKAHFARHNWRACLQVRVPVPEKTSIKVKLL